MKEKKHKTLLGKPKRLSKELFAAAMFAKKMQDDGINGGLANYKAGQYYGFSASDVGFARNQLKQAKSIFNN